MNERIRELAVQAGCKVMDGEWYIPSATGLEKIVYTKEIGLEKFAELIIRHCASQVRFTDLLLCNDDSDGEILLQASVQLKRHFGVEE